MYRATVSVTQFMIPDEILWRIAVYWQYYAGLPFLPVAWRLVGAIVNRGMSGSSWSYVIDTLLYVALLYISMQCTPPSVTWMRAMTQGAPTWWQHQRDRLAAQRKRLLSSMCECGLRAFMMKGLCGALLPLPVVL